MSDLTRQKDGRKRGCELSPSQSSKIQKLDKASYSQFSNKSFNQQDYEACSTQEDNLNIPAHNAEPTSDLKNKDKEFSNELQQPKPHNSNSKRQRTSPAAEESKESERKQNEDRELVTGQENVKKPTTSNEHTTTLGKKATFHGDIYQLKLLMLFLKRGLDCGYSFKLATEMKDTEMFDDVVFQYDEGPEKVYRFLQAKHKQNDDQKITATNLLTETDGEFSLQKYFISYCKIKRNQQCESSKFKDFVICTNADLNQELKESCFEPVEGEDDIFTFKGETSERLKLKLNQFPKKEDLISRLEDTSELRRLAKRLAKCVIKDKLLDLRDKLFRSYHRVLVEKIIDVKKNEKGKKVEKSDAQFFTNFLDGTEELISFRSAFFQAYQRMSKKQNKAESNEENAKEHTQKKTNKVNSKEETITEFCEKMREKKLKISEDFGKVFQLGPIPQFTDVKSFTDKIVNAINNAINSNRDVVKLNRKSAIMKDNIDKLAGHVLIEKGNTEKDTGTYYYFRSDFFDGNNELPDNFQSFKDALKSKLESKSIEWKKCKFQIANFQTCEEDKLHLQTSLPEDDIAVGDIESFFEKLVFAVNQPNEVKLGNIIEEEIGQDFNLIDSEFIAAKFQKDMLDWMKDKKGRFLTNVEGRQFFEIAKQKISKLILIGPTLEYRAKIEAIGKNFKKNLLESINSFLDCENKQIYILFNPHDTILSSMKVYQVLKGIDKYQKDDSHIFISLSSLLRIQDRVIEAFKSKESNLLVIDCEDAEVNDELFSPLFREASSNKHKKIILITQKNNGFADKIKTKLSKDMDLGDSYEEAEDEKNNFTDLASKSQTKLLKGGKVTFQGEEVSLKKLVNDQSKRLIDGEVLSKLIKEKEIKIGSKVPQKSDRGSPCYNIIQSEIEIECIKDEGVTDNLFVITEIKEEKLTGLGILKEKIYSSDIGNLKLNDIETKQIFLLNSKDRDENIDNFERVCQLYSDKLIHFIEFKHNKFIWNRYYDPDFYFFTNRQFYRIEIDANKLPEYFKEAGEKGDKFFVSGITKENFEKDYNIDKRAIASSTDDNLDESQFIIVSGEEKDLRGRLKAEANIHWLESNERKLFWERSKGTTSELSKLVVSKPSSTPKSLLDIVKNTKATVIADRPGMGKSTTLTLLSESYKKEKDLQFDWVIRVNLRDYSSEIDDLPVDKPELKDVVKFFSAIDKEGLKDTLAKNLFNYRLKEKKKTNILLLFDGFDEISSGRKGVTGQTTDKQQKMTNLLKFLKDDTYARIVVTTRSYEQEKTSLENTLSVLSYTFKPISEDIIEDITEDERQKFLINFWKKRFKLKNRGNEGDESNYKKRAKNLIQSFDKANNANKEASFLGITLHLRMLAEVHSKKLEFNVSQDDDFKYIKPFELYKDFIQIKYKIYFSEKTGVSSTLLTNVDLGFLKKQYDKMHGRLAFEYLFSLNTDTFWHFSPAQSELYFSKNKKPDEKNKEMLRGIGITLSGRSSAIDFIHDTFAEYFVSKLIYQRLKQKLENPNYCIDSKNSMRKFLLKHIFIKKENNVIRSFIDFELANDSKKPLAEQFWSSEIGFLTIDHLLDAAKEGLLVAVKEGLNNVFSFLLKSEKDKKIKELISEPRKHIQQLCNKGEHEKANLLTGNALEFLKELGKDHLEVAFMQRYYGNACGTYAENEVNETERSNLFEEKKKNVKEAINIFKKHLKVAKKGAQDQEKYFQQALSTFKEDISIKAESADKLNKTERGVWIRVLEIEIAKATRNLAKAYGNLKNHPKEKKFLIKILSTFEKYIKDPKVKKETNLLRDLEIEKAKATRNLGNAWGDLENHSQKKKLLEKALYIFEKYLEDAKKQKMKQRKSKDKEKYDKLFKYLNVRSAEVKGSLGNAEGELGHQDKKKRLHEDSLPHLVKHYGFLNNKVTKAQKDLGEAYEGLECPLHGAVIAGDINKVEEELKKGADGKKQANGVKPPLELAVREGHPDIVELLIKRVDFTVIKTVLKQAKEFLRKENENLNQNQNQNQQIYQKIINILESK